MADATETTPATTADVTATEATSAVANAPAEAASAAETTPAADEALDASLTSPAPMAASETAVNDNQAADESLVDKANAVLTQALSKAKVTQLLTKAERPMPVAAVKLGAPENGQGGLLRVADSSTPVQLSVTLSRPVGDYAIDSLNAALKNLLDSLPSLAGKLQFMSAGAEKETVGDVWTQVQALLAAKPDAFTAAEQATLAAYFKEHAEDSTRWGGWDRITVSHDDGKVVVRLNPKPPEDEATQVIGNDLKVQQYVTDHKDAILANVREQVKALVATTPELAGITDEQLAKLDMKTSLKKERYEGDAVSLELGLKGEGEALLATDLIKINAAMMDKIFTKALVESSPELPSILPEVADGDMIGNVLAKRLEGVAGLDAVLKNELFKSADERRAEYKVHQKAGESRIQPAEEGADPKKLVLNFDLPPKVDLATIRSEIVQHERQIVAGMQPSGGRSAA